MQRSTMPAAARAAALALSLAACGAAAGGRLGYAAPPAVGDVIVPQRQLFRCTSADGARRTAGSGFLNVGCEPLVEHGVWRVVACTDERLSHGPLRLVEVVADDGRRAWIPLPWHDWV